MVGAGWYYDGALKTGHDYFVLPAQEHESALVRPRRALAGSRTYTIPTRSNSFNADLLLTSYSCSGSA